MMSVFGEKKYQSAQFAGDCFERDYLKTKLIFSHLSHATTTKAHGIWQRKLQTRHTEMNRNSVLFVAIISRLETAEGGLAGSVNVATINHIKETGGNDMKTKPSYFCPAVDPSCGDMKNCADCEFGELKIMMPAATACIACGRPLYLFFPNKAPYDAICLNANCNRGNILF